MLNGRYEKHRDAKGLAGKHELAKEFLAGIAGAEVSLVMACHLSHCTAE